MLRVVANNQCHSDVKKLCNVVFLLCDRSNKLHHPSTPKCGKDNRKRATITMKGSFVNNVMERLLSKYYSKSVKGLPMLKDETKYQVCHHFKTKLIDLDKELPELENNNNYTPILGTGIAGQLLATRRSTRTNDHDVIQLDDITSVRIKVDGEIFEEQEYPKPIPLFVRKPVEEEEEDNDEQEE